MGDILLSEIVARPTITWHRDILGNYRAETTIHTIIPPNVNCLLKKDINTDTLVKINNIEISNAEINKLKDGQVILVKADSESNVRFELESKPIETNPFLDFASDYSDNDGEGFGILIMFFSNI